MFAFPCHGDHFAIQKHKSKNSHNLYCMLQTMQALSFVGCAHCEFHSYTVVVLCTKCISSLFIPYDWMFVLFKYKLSVKLQTSNNVCVQNHRVVHEYTKQTTGLISDNKQQISLYDALNISISVINSSIISVISSSFWIVL